MGQVRRQYKEFIKLFSEHKILTIVGIFLTLSCIAGYFLQARPWDVGSPWTEFRKESFFAFGVEFLIIWVTVVVVYFVLEGRKKRERVPVYRAVSADAHDVYRKMFDWIFHIMKEEFANDERHALREHKEYPRIDDYLHPQANGPIYLQRDQASEVVFRFFEEYEGRPIYVDRYKFERRLNDIEKDVEHFQQCHGAFLASDETEEAGSRLTHQFRDLRAGLRELQGTLGYDGNVNTKGITLRFLKNARTESEKRKPFYIEINGEKVHLKFLEELERNSGYKRGKEYENYERKWTAPLTNFDEKWEREEERKKESEYRLSNLVDVLTGDVLKPEEKEPVSLRYPEALKLVHEKFRKRGKRKIAEYNLGIINRSFAREHGAGLCMFDKLTHCSVTDRGLRARAHFNRGLIFLNAHLHGDCEARGLSEARKEFECAAFDPVHKDAAFFLGIIYRDGLGVAKDVLKAREWFEKAAGPEGVTNKEAPVEGLGVVYRKGRYERERLLTGREWYGVAAKQGHGEAQYILGEMHMEGLEKTLAGSGRAGRVRGSETAVNRFCQAAEQGHADARYRLGLAYWKRRGSERGTDEAEADAEAVKWFHEAAEQGHADASYRLGLAYWERRGMVWGIDEAEPDAEAVKRFHEAAEQGHADACYRLGLAYWVRRGTERGMDDAEADAEAVKWFREAARWESADARYYLGLAYWERRGMERGIQEAEANAEAVKWFRDAARQDHVDAQYQLGCAYRQGRGIPKDVQATWMASDWFRRAARQGHSGARSFLGEAYLDGKGVAKHILEDADWLPESVDQADTGVMKRLLGVAMCGHADARFALGLAYWGRRGSAKPGTNEAREDPEATEAVKWFREAAKPGQDHVGAQYHLWLAYLEGWGVKANVDEAVDCFREAARQGNHGARECLERVAERGDEQGIRKARKYFERDREGADNQFRKGLAYWERRGRAKPGTNGAQGNPEATEAVEWFHEAARRGHVGAQYHLGLAYLEGRGVTANVDEAVDWFRRAARQGHIDARDELGVMWLQDHDQVEGIAEAASYARASLQREAERGDLDARSLLGLIHREGRGVDVDVFQALDYFKHAANERHAGGRFQLARMLHEGRGFVFCRVVWLSSECFFEGG